MPQAFVHLLLFTSKLLIVFLFIVFLLIALVAILAKAKGKSPTAKLKIKNLSQKYETIKENLLSETVSKKEFKQLQKAKKQKLKLAAADTSKQKIYILQFQG